MQWYFEKMELKSALHTIILNQQVLHDALHRFVLCGEILNVLKCCDTLGIREYEIIVKMKGPNRTHREKFSTVQHFHGYYRCVAVTAKYTTKMHSCGLAPLIESALTKVVLEHPMLCAGIIDENTEKPAFVRLDTIDLSKCVEYRDVIAFTLAEYNEVLENILERQHSLQWPDMPRRPGWKIIVLQSTALSSNKTSFDIVFAYHHALADGVSGLIFHHSLLDALESNTAVENQDRFIKIPRRITLPSPLENQLNFTVSLPFLLREFLKGSIPVWMKCLGKTLAWTGAPSSLKQIQNYRSRSKILTIGAYQLALVLASCRKQKATLTGLLYGIIVVSLTSHVPRAKRFEAGVPYSLRQLLDDGSSDEMGEMGCFAWGCSIRYSAETISKIRSRNTDAQLTNDIWEIARSFSTSIATELGQLPKDNFIGLLPRVKNLHKAFKSKIGRPRSQTFEVSNIGVFKNGSGDAGWKIEKMIFSQSGMATGPAISFNVVSVVGGPLTICATWLDGAIRETLVNLVCEDILHILNIVSKGIATYGGMEHPGVLVQDE